MIEVIIVKNYFYEIILLWLFIWSHVSFNINRIVCSNEGQIYESYELPWISRLDQYLYILMDPNLYYNVNNYLGRGWHRTLIYVEHLQSYSVANFPQRLNAKNIDLHYSLQKSYKQDDEFHYCLQSLMFIINIDCKSIFTWKFPSKTVICR